MSLIVVGAFKVDPKVTNDNRACNRECKEKNCKLAYLNYCHSLAKFISRIEDFREDESHRSCEDDPAHSGVGCLRLLDSFPEDSGAKLASIQIDTNGDEHPLVQVDEVGYAEEEATRIVKETHSCNWQVSTRNTGDVQQNNRDCDEFAKECQLEESEVSPETTLTDLSCCRVFTGRRDILANVNYEPK